MPARWISAAVLDLLVNADLADCGALARYSAAACAPLPEVIEIRSWMTTWRDAKPLRKGVTVIASPRRWAISADGIKYLTDSKTTASA